MNCEGCAYRKKQKQFYTCVNPQLRFSRNIKKTKHSCRLPKNKPKWCPGRKTDIKLHFYFSVYFTNNQKIVLSHKSFAYLFSKNKLVFSKDLYMYNS